MKRLAFLLIGLRFAGALVWAGPPDEWDRINVGRVQEAIYRLDFSAAQKAAESMMKERPEDPSGYGMDSVVALNQLLFAAKNLTLDDYATPTPFFRQPTYKPIEEARMRFLKTVQDLVEVCDARLAGNPEDSRALYFKGLAYENMATVALAVRKDLGSAQKHGKKARNLHQRALKIDPELVDANISIAVHEYAAATLPWGIKWLAFLLGNRGNKKRAIRRLETVANQGFYRRLDAQVLLALLHAWKGDPQDAIPYFSRLRNRYPENFLSDINLAAIYELRLEQPSEALRIYRQLLQGISRKAPGIEPGEVHFRIGKTLYSMGDYTQAIASFEQAIVAEQGELETGPLAHYHIARILEKRGERSQARDHYRKVLEYAGPSEAIKDELKQARKKARKNLTRRAPAGAPTALRAD